MAPRKDGAATPDRSTVEQEHGSPSTKPPPSVYPAEDGKLREQEKNVSNLLPNDSPPQNSTVTQNENNWKTRSSVRFQGG